MIFWLVLKLEISYRVIMSLKDFGFLRGFFWVKFLSFHNSSFALRYLLM